MDRQSPDTVVDQPTADQPAESSESPPHDIVYEMLGNERRRHVIRVLRERNEPISLDHLAKEVAALEYDVDVETVTRDQRNRTYTSLQQTHLPKMADGGALSFDKDTGRVVPDESITKYVLHLDVATGAAPPQGLVYLSLSGLSALLVVLAWSGVAPVSRVAVLDWGVVVVLAFGTLALGQRALRVLSDDRL